MRPKNSLEDSHCAACFSESTEFTPLPLYIKVPDPVSFLMMGSQNTRLLHYNFVDAVFYNAVYICRKSNPITFQEVFNVALSMTILNLFVINHLSGENKTGKLLLTTLNSITVFFYTFEKKKNN